jgi:hypothetical protein
MSSPRPSSLRFDAIARSERRRRREEETGKGECKNQFPFKPHPAPHHLVKIILKFYHRFFIEPLALAYG